MLDQSTLRERFEAASAGEHGGVFFVLLALVFLAAGYAAGGVLAGEPLTDQLALLPVVGLCAVLAATLAVRQDD